jgi:hypothetical protein
MKRMKTKAVLIGVVLTGMVSGPLLAQVDTGRKSKTSPAWKNQRDTTGRKDTAWKPRRDTNQVNVGGYYRQNEDKNVPSIFHNQPGDGWAISKLLTQDMVMAGNRWLVRKNRNEDWKQGTI